MATQYSNLNIPISGCVLYLNFSDRNCYVSGSFTGRELINGNTINFQNQIRFNTASNGSIRFTSPNQGLNASGSMLFSSTVTFPNQFTHILLATRAGTPYEQTSYVRPSGSGNMSSVTIGGQNAGINNSFSSLISNVTITNSTDWFFVAGKSERIGSAWTQSLFTRAFFNGSRIFEQKTQNSDWSQTSGSISRIDICPSLTDANIAMYMSFTRPLSTSEINTIYDSIKFRFNLPIQ